MAQPRTATTNLVQTYNREAERLGERIAAHRSDPALVKELASAVKSQARDLSSFIIENSSASIARKKRA